MEIWLLKDNRGHDLDLLGSRDVIGHMTIWLGICGFLLVVHCNHAHAPCHVTYKQGVQNNRIFGIPKATLPIHYATLVGLRWRLKVVCRWASPLLSIFRGPKISKKCGFRGWEKENIKDKCWDPLGNQSPPKHVIQSKKYGDTPKNVFSRLQSLAQRV